MASHLSYADEIMSAWLQWTWGWLLRGPQPAVTRQGGTTRPTAIRPLGSLCRLRPSRHTTWVYVTYDPGSAPRLACRDNEYSPLNLHF
jgi:hypothetical protein